MIEWNKSSSLETERKLNLEVLVDIRDELVNLNGYMKDVSSASQIYQEINPI